jgi:hypothetical protein
VLAELRDLEAARDQLHADVDILERHLEEQRDRVRLTTRELQRLLDDPEALREVTLPVMSQVVVPATASTPTMAPEPAPVAEPAEEPPAAWAPDADAWEDSPAAAPPPSPAYADAPVEEDEGPSTQPVDVLAERDADDDAYLAELRKAMTDESPLGPREEGDGDPLFDSSPEPSRSRFGRRR